MSAMQPDATEAGFGGNESDIRDRGAQADPAHGVEAKLIRMANQIATFFSSQDPRIAVEGVAIHINKFWEPRMRRSLLDLYAKGDHGLHPLVLEAEPLIRRPKADPNSAPGTGRDAARGAPEGKGTAMGEMPSRTNFPEIPPEDLKH
jgi:formate dehydrogenase subunit delta